jgi:hypothetical protein
MKLNDLMNLKGEVLIQTITKAGEITTVINDKNLIVLNGRRNICNFLSGVSASYISDIAFGDGGTVAGNTNVALPVSPDETVLNSVISATKITDYSFLPSVESSPSPRLVFSIVVPQFNTALNGDSGQGQPISELALMLNTSPATAFAIKRFPAISKSDTISLLITWIIYI